MNNPTNRASRIASMLVDHLIMSLVILFLSVPFFVSSLLGKTGHEDISMPNLFSGFGLFVIFGFALYLCKDVIQGRSVAKRLLKLQVVNHADGLQATPLQCFVRNIFILVWPLELIMALISPQRRIGDYVAGTRLTAYDAEHRGSAKPVQVLFSLVLALTLLYLFRFPYESARAEMSVSSNFVPESANEEAARKLETLLADSLSQMVTAADVMVYDRLHDDSSKKYISVILHLRRNYLSNEGENEELNRLAFNQIYSRYPEGSFKGKVKFTYQEAGQWHSKVQRVE